MNERSLLQNREYVEALERSLKNCKKEVLIVSAYLRSEILVWAKEIIPKNVIVNIVTRWTLQDLLFGASDIQAYELARSEKWGFYIDQDLHAKSVLVDAEMLFLGSANFTSRGTHLFGFGNNELGIQVLASKDEADKIKKYVTNSYKLTMPMYIEMKRYLESPDKSKERESVSWPADIETCISPLVDKLWIDECFHSSPNEFFSDMNSLEIEHDRLMFASNKPSLKLIKQTKMMKWLDHIINDSNKEIITFGYISKRLHDAIVTDPKPYRKDVKEFVKCLLSWVRYFKVYELISFKHTIAVRCYRY